MPKLIQFYIRQALMGYALSAAFVGLLMWFNVANLWHLVSTSDVGWLAVLMLFVFNGIVFTGAQVSISVLRMGESEEDGPRGGRRAPILPAVPVAVPVEVEKRQDRHDRRGV